MWVFSPPPFTMLFWTFLPILLFTVPLLCRSFLLSYILSLPCYPKPTCVYWCWFSFNWIWPVPWSKGAPCICMPPVSRMLCSRRRVGNKKGSEFKEFNMQLNVLWIAKLQLGNCSSEKVQFFENRAVHCLHVFLLPSESCIWLHWSSASERRWPV